MEHNGLYKLFEAVLPIAIFVLWALTAKSSGKKKNSSNGRNTDKEPDQENSDATASTSQDENEFSYENTSPENVPYEEAGSSPEAEIEEKKETDSVSANAYRMQPEKNSPKKTDANNPDSVSYNSYQTTVENIQVQNTDIYKQTLLNSSASSAVQDAVSIKSISGGLTDYSSDDLKKFIVWSEVLGKPVGIKDLEP
jgi:hypothetical protein